MLDKQSIDDDRRLLKNSFIVCAYGLTMIIGSITVICIFGVLIKMIFSGVS